MVGKSGDGCKTLPHIPSIPLSIVAEFGTPPPPPSPATANTNNYHHTTNNAETKPPRHTPSQPDRQTHAREIRGQVGKGYPLGSLGAVLSVVVLSVVLAGAG